SLWPGWSGRSDPSGSGPWSSPQPRDPPLQGRGRSAPAARPSAPEPGRSRTPGSEQGTDMRCRRTAGDVMNTNEEVEDRAGAHVPTRAEIVVGIDESAASAAALRWAVAHSQDTGLPLRLVHTWQLS